MENINLVMGSSPHIRTETDIKKIMYSVILALLPATIGAVYFFRLNGLLVILVAIISAVITEAVIQYIRKKPITIYDGSAVITGLLLALTLPPLPFKLLWMPAVGSVIAIALGKQVFGGLGQNPFNPALVGRAFLVISFSVPMTTWYKPIDMVTTATPLNKMKMDGIPTDYLKLFLGNIGGCIGETSALLLLIGGLYLIYKGYIDWKIPAGFIGTVFILTLFLGHDPIFHILSGGLFIGAFFMATDYVTTPVTKLGRLIFGIGSGLFVVIIRLYGAYPEGVMFAILLMNAFTPIINRYTKGRIYGEVKR